MAVEAGYSRRHQRAKFLSEYGITPKQAARIVRFERSSTMIRHLGRTPADPAKAASSLSDIAARCGHYDQAHLTRDWNGLAGCPPSRWLRSEDLPFVQADDEIASHPGDDPGTINQAVLRWTSGAIVTVHSAEPEIVPFADLGPRSPTGIYLRTDDPDGVHQRALSAGATQVGGPENSAHGTRDATVADPEGCLWSFGNYRGD